MFLPELPSSIQAIEKLCPPVSANAIAVAAKRYFDRTIDMVAGKPVPRVNEDIYGLYYRVAKHIAKAKNEDETAVAGYYHLLRTHFLPNSPCLANAGTRTQQLSACFVLPVPDNLEGIYQAVKEAQLIQQTGGGVGFSFGRLRRKGGLTRGSYGEASGPCDFMNVFDAACESLKQGGMRRGAQMGILPVTHPDIKTFIEAKQDLTRWKNFNVSVGVTAAFMKSWLAGEDYELIDPDQGPTGEFLSAQEVMNVIIGCAWRTGEPGLVFLDRMNEYNPNKECGDYEATNPCGEQPLLPYESCNLGSMNLESFVKYEPVAAKWVFDFVSFRAAVHKSVRFMDSTIDLNQFAANVPELREMALLTRKLGLGIMGSAHALFLLGLNYESTEGRQFLGAVMAVLDSEARLASYNLAREFEPSPYQIAHPEEANAFNVRVTTERIKHAAELGKWAGIAASGYKALLDQHASTGGPLLTRNSTLTTIAPTGTISIFHETSGGCEPVFGLVMTRMQADMVMEELNPTLKTILDQRIHETFRKEWSDIIFEALRDQKNKGSLRKALSNGAFEECSKELQTVVCELSEYMVVAPDVSPEGHVRMQAVLQQFNDSAVSKTINLPEEATEKDVADAYRLAIELNCKGITVYRDNCRAFQPLSAGDTTKKVDVPTTFEEQTKANRGTLLERRVRPEILSGLAQRTETSEGRLYTQVNYDDQGIRELVLNIGKSGGAMQSMAEALGRLASLCLQYHVPVADIIHTLGGIRGPESRGFGERQVLSIPDAIAKVLSKMPRFVRVVEALDGADLVPEVAPAVLLAPTPTQDHTSRAEALLAGHSPECPHCSATLIFGREGCRGGTCSNAACGYQKCS